MKEERNLIISPDKKYWEVNKPTLFAGDWCLNPLEKNSWHSIDFKVLKTDVFETENMLKEINFCDAIYEQLLKELAPTLNRLHEVNWSLRSWRIVIGPWLDRYVAISNNRLNLLIQSNKDYTVCFKNISFKDDSLASFDLLDYTDKAGSHEWNEKIMRRLYKLYSGKEFDHDYLNSLKFENFETYKKNKVYNILQFFKNKINYFWKIFPFSKKNNFFLHNIYIGNFFISLKLFIGLKDFPVKYFLDEERISKNFDLNIRKKIKINFQVQNFKEKIIRYLLIESMPTLYIEGFKDMIKKVLDSNLPEEEKNIFTCLCHSDTVFKFWVAESINNGSKLFYGQHGSMYGIVKQSPHMKHELKVSDKYLTWGWEGKDNKDKIIPSIAFPFIKDKASKNYNTKEIPLVTTAMEYYTYKNDTRKTNKLYNDLDLLNNFINNLDKRIFNNLVFKAHPVENVKSKEFSYLKYIQKNHSKIKVYKTFNNLEKIIDNSKISVFFYLATSFLRSLTLNKPCILIYPCEFEELINDECLFLFQKLKSANIVQEDAIKAAKFLNTNYDQINDWWYNDKTQIVRKEFSNIFAKKKDDSLKSLINLLNKQKFHNNK